MKTIFKDLLYFSVMLIGVIAFCVAGFYCVDGAIDHTFNGKVIITSLVIGCCALYFEDKIK